MIARKLRDENMLKMKLNQCGWKRFLCLLLVLLTVLGPTAMLADNPLVSTVAADSYTYTYYPRYTGSSGSIVTALKAIGVDSSYANRKNIAAINNISNYSGTAAQNTQLLQLLKQGKLIRSKTLVSTTANGSNLYYPRYTGTSGSIVTALNAIKVDSSFANRKVIAANNGISNYSGTASQNTTMLQLLKQGKLKKSNSVSVPSNSYISANEIQRAASAYGIPKSSSAYAALNSINTKYANKLSASQRNGTVIFMFEGVGNNSSSAKRLNAMCVVVRKGSILYINRNSSTIPDYPFDPSKNSNTHMPTLKSGVYQFTTVNHRGSYAALNVSSAKVVRFRSKSSYYESTSPGINIHRRFYDTIKAGWVDSAGCQLVGLSGTDSSSEYAKFIKAVGIVTNNATGASKYSSRVSGTYVVDRTYAESYLRNVGYPKAAINMIG